MKDNRILLVTTADALARYKRYRLLYMVRGGNGARACYVFGKRILTIGGWEDRRQG